MTPQEYKEWLVKERHKISNILMLISQKREALAQRNKFNFTLLDAQLKIEALFWKLDYIILNKLDNRSYDDFIIYY